MRIALVAGFAVATVLAPPTLADDAVGVQWRVEHDADDESAQGTLELAMAVTGLEDDTGLMGTRRCAASTRPLTKHASITYSDAAGLPTYAFFHDVTFEWNCKVVTRVSRSVRYEIYQPQYSFAGYVQNSVTPSNRAAVTSSAQGRFGLCQSAVGSTCLLERQPSITWRIEATGRATVKTTP